MTTSAVVSNTPETAVVTSAVLKLSAKAAGSRLTFLTRRLPVPKLPKDTSIVASAVTAMNSPKPAAPRTRATMTKYAPCRRPRTPLRAHIHAVLATSRSGCAVPAPPGADVPRSALTGTGASDRRGQGPEEDPQVEPERPVADVVRVASFLPG